jgi:REP element-mobilizing transposase RayT
MQYMRGGYYHIYNRGNNRKVIFPENRNYFYMLRLLKKYRSRCDLTVLAYCLMPNHYHFLFRQDGDISLSVYLKSVFQSFVQSMNRRYGATGQMFEGNPQAKPVEAEEYLLCLCSYIHLNPVEGGIVSEPGQWPFSNYLEFVGKRPGTLCDREFIRTAYRSPEDYEKFTMGLVADRQRRGEIGRFLFDE